jgi:hypothetical protein
MSGLAATRPLAESELLAAADAAGGSPLAGGLALLGLEDAPVADLDARLLALRAATFGPLLEAVAACPGCELELELELDARAMAARGCAGAAGTAPGGFRLPTARDLEAVAAEPDPERARELLASRCAPGRELTPALVDEIAAAIADADPLGGSRLALTCPACGREWVETLDVAWLVQVEFANAGARLAAEVHELASAYGWTESEILALPPRRRARYLELVGA